MYLKMFDLTGRRAYVTGGGRAIGLSCCEALAEAGAHVVIGDISAEVAEEGRDYLKSKGYDASIDLMDVTNPDQVAGQRMDVFVRPEAITIAAKGQGPVATSGLNAMQGRVENLLFNGAASSVQLRETTTGHEMNVALPQTGAFAGLRNGDELDLSWSASQTKCFPNTKAAQADVNGEAVA